MLVFNNSLSAVVLTKFDLEKVVGYFAYLRQKSHQFTDTLKMKYNLLLDEEDGSQNIRIHQWNQWHDQPEDFEFDMQQQFSFFIDHIEDTFNYPINVNINLDADHGAIMHVSGYEYGFEELLDVYNSSTLSLQLTFDMEDFINKLRFNKEQNRINELQNLLKENGIEDNIVSSLAYGKNPFKQVSETPNESK